MEKLLALHAPILQDIQKIIEQKYHIKADHIRPVNFSIVDDTIMKFQLSFDLTHHHTTENQVLNFELREHTPQSLFFETIAGFKGYAQSNHYHGLEVEIVKYIENNLG